jgi:SH3 domain protein
MNKSMTLWPCLAILLTLQAGFAAAQETRYILDTMYVPVRSGQGSQFRITHRGLPSGTRVTVRESSEESGYSYIVTDNGTEGWVLTRYLMSQPAAKDRLAALQQRYDSLTGDESSLRSQLVEAQEKVAAGAREASQLRRELEKTREELTEVKRISGNAMSLDSSNRRLIKEAQVMKTRIEVVEADNTRLKESKDSRAFINGALAVLLGVVIALVVPRLRPKPRSSTSWA